MEIGIMYGTPLPKFGKRANEAKLTAVIEAFEQEDGDRILPEITSGNVVGYWVAIGAGGDFGEPPIRQVELVHLKRDGHYRRARVVAKRRWDEFFRFAKKQGATFERPRLYLAWGETG